MKKFAGKILHFRLREVRQIGLEFPTWYFAT